MTDLPHDGGAETSSESVSRETTSNANAEDPVTLREDDFIQDETDPRLWHGPPVPAGFGANVPMSTGYPISAVSTPPGPGMLESLLWTIFLHVMQVIGVIAAMFVVMILFILQSGGGGRLDEAFQSPEQINELFMSEYMLEVLCTVQLVFVLGAMIAAPLRMGWASDPQAGTTWGAVGPPMHNRRGIWHRFFRRLSLNPIPWPHVALIFCAVLPLSIFASSIYDGVNIVWEELVQIAPGLRGLDEVNTMESIDELVGSGDFFLLTLVIAVAPALGEELVFRGIIGRGLVARHGLLVGMILTSVLFGMAHLHPVHAIGVIPLGLAMHYAYYVTRSFWAPVLIHFLNNFFALSVARFLVEDVEAADGERPWWLAIVAALTLWAIAVFLWKTRVRFETAPGVEFEAGYDNFETPPAEIPARRTREAAEPISILVTVFGVLAFFACLVLAGLLQADQNDPADEAEHEANTSYQAGGDSHQALIRQQVLYGKTACKRGFGFVRES